MANKTLEGTTLKLAEELKKIGRITCGPQSNAYYTAKANPGVFYRKQRQDGGWTISLKPAYR